MTEFYYNPQTGVIIRVDNPTPEEQAQLALFIQNGFQRYNPPNFGEQGGPGGTTLSPNPASNSVTLDQAVADTIGPAGALAQGQIDEARQRAQASATVANERFEINSDLLNLDTNATERASRARAGNSRNFGRGQLTQVLRNVDQRAQLQQRLLELTRLNSLTAAEDQFLASQRSALQGINTQNPLEDLLITDLLNQRLEGVL